MSVYLGDFTAGATVRVPPFVTSSSAGGTVAPLSAFEAADLKIYRDGSAVERASSSGVTMTSPFDTTTGLHAATIDLSDNADAGFYAAGHDYDVVLVPDETVDGQIVARTVASFSIQNRYVATPPGAQPAYPLKQATALEIVFFVESLTGGPATGLVDGGFTKRIKKQGGSFAAMTVTITEEENGWYKATLSTSHSDTLGGLWVTFTHASAKNVNLQWRVSQYLPDDIGAKTVNLPSDPADASDLLALLTAIDDYIDVEVASILTAANAIKAKTDNLPAAPAATGDIPTAAAIADAVYDEDDGKLRAHVKTVIKCVVGAASTTTTVVLDASTGINGGVPSAVDDFYNNCVIKFTSGALLGQVAQVSDYNGTTKTLTVTQMTSAPSASDTAVME